jgi:hypothetical protein
MQYVLTYQWLLTLYPRPTEKAREAVCLLLSWLEFHGATLPPVVWMCEIVFLLRGEFATTFTIAIEEFVETLQCEENNQAVEKSREKLINREMPCVA